MENAKAKKLITGLCRLIPALILAVIFVVALAEKWIVIDSKLTKVQSWEIIGIFVMFVASTLLGAFGKTIVHKAYVWALVILTPPAAFILQELYNNNPFNGSPVMKDDIMIINILLLYAIMFVWLAVTTRTDVAVALSAVIPFGFGLANFLSYEFRAAPIYPWDILSFGTAMSVLDNYTFKPDLQFIFIVYTFVFIISTAFLGGSSILLKKKKLRLVNLAAAVCSFAVFAGMFFYFRSDKAEKKYGYYPYLFSETYLYKYNGTPLTMVWTTKFLTVEKPENYSLNEIKAVYDEQKEKEQKTAEVKPNIIVIMNEAFSDVRSLGLDFEPNVEYMPFISGLENCAKGNIYCSVKGGNTANSEYEFLTGMSMAFLPTGSIPYQQYVTGDTPSLVTQLEEEGYESLGMHPYSASGWKRDEVYPWLGFNSTMFSRDFKNTTKIRSYISDKSMYQTVIKQIENKENDKPLFLFGVTMQNHGGYTTDYANFKPDVKVRGISSNVLSQYLSLIKISDSAFEYLINYIDENIEEPTVVLMFGDHQPNDNVVNPIYKLNKKSTNLASYSTEDQQKRYITPYVMWANYDIDYSAMPENISLNYLAGALLETVGLKLTPFQQWQKEIRVDYPVLDALCFARQKGSGLEFVGLSENYGDSAIRLYERIQYNFIFGKKSRVDGLFEVK